VKQLFCMVLLTILTATSYAAVEKRYVSDKLWLQLRSGPGGDFRILKALPSGEHLIYRGQTENKNYTQVTTDKGVDGWVLSRFLEDEPVALEKLILSQRELVKVKAELNTLKKQTATLSEEKSSLSGDRSSLTRENKTLTKELERIKEISANALQLDSKNTLLTKRNQELEIQLETLTAENTRLKDTKERTFMIIGGGLITFGLFLGLAIPAMRGGRKAASWS
jgi:SH3 domain protein